VKLSDNRYLLLETSLNGGHYWL